MVKEWNNIFSRFVAFESAFDLKAFLMNLAIFRELMGECHLILRQLRLSLCRFAEEVPSG